ncbi:uncharacterized protein LOC135210377 [Macrobrachium nipponense]|uniref:uncharacterized protein LOC135210377 n=1 Tax=Macrobrachium nipponense TaxID=159736 RepID=UPI0030C8576D
MDLVMECKRKIIPMQEPVITKEKVIACLSKLKAKKAAGPDGIKPELYKALMKSKTCTWQDLSAFPEIGKNLPENDRRFIMYDVKSEVHKGHLHLKTDLYENLLRLESAHAAIVHNVEKIPGEAAMTFHAFCDNENAPFKQAVIILVIHIPGKYENLSWERLENTIDDYLMGIWGEQLQEKDVSAIVSRVANAPVLIKPESAERLNYACESL